LDPIISPVMSDEPPSTPLKVNDSNAEVSDLCRNSVPQPEIVIESLFPALSTVDVLSFAKVREKLPALLGTCRHSLQRL
jgi:hypothetical protein